MTISESPKETSALHTPNQKIQRAKALFPVLPFYKF